MLFRSAGAWEGDEGEIRESIISELLRKELWEEEEVGRQVTGIAQESLRPSSTRLQRLSPIFKSSLQGACQSVDCKVI